MTPEQIQEMRLKLGIPPQGFKRSKALDELQAAWGRSSDGSVERARNEAEGAEQAAEDANSVGGMAKAALEKVGELSGVTPTAKKIAAGIAPAVVSQEELPGVVEDLAGGVDTPQPGKIAEFAETALDLPLISLGLSKNLAGVIGKQIANDATALGKPLIQLLPKEITDALQAELKNPVKAAAEGVENIADATKEKAGAAMNTAKAWMRPDVKANVQSALGETKVEDFDAVLDVVRKSVQSNKNKTGFELVGERAQEALTKHIQPKIDMLGKQKRERMNIAGLNPIDKKILTDFNQQLQSFRNNSLTVEGDSKLITVIRDKIKELEEAPTVTANDVDKFIDWAQGEIYSRSRNLTVPVTDATTARLRGLVGRLNGGLKKQLPEWYTEVNSELERLYDMRDQLNPKLGKDGSQAGALIKRVFSPADAGAKKLFAEVLEETGIDLVNEATVARYLGDILGDARQKSMLEQLQLLNTKPSPSNILNQLVDYVAKKANDPEELIKEARALTLSAGH